uniref:Uncharacterized protein n=1 Tax=Kalanchoe fedtschenkoi TaxID=63787 RepID=A0A7N0VBR5_KALFE
MTRQLPTQPKSPKILRPALKSQLWISSTSSPSATTIPPRHTTLLSTSILKSNTDLHLCHVSTKISSPSPPRSDLPPLSHSSLSSPAFTNQSTNFQQRSVSIYNFDIGILLWLPEL